MCQNKSRMPRYITTETVALFSSLKRACVTEDESYAFTLSMESHWKV
jgi:hypothetical protein